MSPFTAEQVDALLDLGRVLGARTWVLIGASALRCHLELQRFTADLDLTAEPRVLEGGWLQVPRRAGGSEGVRVEVVAWLRGHAEAYLPARLDELCARDHLERPPMVVGEQRARWGSCDARGTLRINWRIVQAPVVLIDDVLLHELTHLAHPTHGRAFWAALGRRLPDYEGRRDRLRMIGESLVW